MATLSDHLLIFLSSDAELKKKKHNIQSDPGGFLL